MNKPLPRNLFTDDVAKSYDSTMVPIFFEPYAHDLAARVQALAPDAVLEVACGTGVVTRALASQLPATCAITATDLSEAMVARAERVGTSRSVHWAQANVIALPYENASFDVVLCQFGVMFFPDRIAAYREIGRVLRPGGTFLFSTWNTIEHNAFDAVVVEALARRYPDEPVTFMSHVVHGYTSPLDIESDVQAAGFDTFQISSLDQVSLASSPEQAAIALCHGTPLRNEIEAREPGGLTLAVAAAADAIRQHFGNGTIEARMSALVIEASKP
ncbi:MAG TPA: class I SAM-dependent methyltransferase [Polyangiaceae bacterium]|nr:class I SAM-dependent methyltransferase [Polyangiaceae bacterium]